MLWCILQMIFKNKVFVSTISNWELHRLRHIILYAIVIFVEMKNKKTKNELNSIKSNQIKLIIFFVEFWIPITYEIFIKFTSRFSGWSRSLKCVQSTCIPLRVHYTHTRMYIQICYILFDSRLIKRISLYCSKMVYLLCFEFDIRSIQVWVQANCKKSKSQTLSVCVWPIVYECDYKD